MNELSYNFRRLEAAVREAGRVILVIHRKPDGDAIGSASAMVSWLKSEGIETAAFCHDPLPRQYAFLDHFDDFTQDADVFRRGWPLVMVLDAGDLRYAGIADIIESLPVRPKIIDFDHHADNVNFGDVNVVCGSASSTCELAYDFFREIDVRPTVSRASALITGIMFDTNSLTNLSTSRSSVDAVAKLMRLGGTSYGYENQILKSKSIASLRVWGKALERIKENKASGVISTALFARDLDEDGVEEEHIEGISNFVDGAVASRASVFLKEMPGGRIKGGLRTSHDLDVSALARLVGGGGHKKASGFTVDGKLVETERGWQIRKGD